MGINKLISERKSTVAFSSQPVGEEQMELIFEAARWAPSSFNEQPWRFIYAHKGTESYEKILSCILPGNLSWAGTAPVLILTVLSKNLQRNGQPNKYAWYDLGQSVGNISAQATDLGLKLHQMGGFDPFKAAELFHINESFESATVIALGYPGDINDLDDGLKQRESGKRSRKSIKEIIFSSNIEDSALIA